MNNRPITIETGIISFPPGGGGNFITGLLYEEQSVNRYEKFNDYKVNYGPNSSLWFYQNDVRLLTKTIKVKEYKAGGSHYMPSVNELMLYDLQFNFMLEINCATVESEFIIDILSLYKNQINVGTTEVLIQIFNMVKYVLGGINQHIFSVPYANLKLTPGVIRLALFSLDAELEQKGLSNVTMYTKGSTVMLMFIYHSILAGITPTVDNFNSFIYHHILKLDNKDHFTLNSSLRNQRKREELQQKLSSKFLPVEYCELFFKCKFPPLFLKYVTPENLAVYKKKTIAYSIENLRLCSEVVKYIIPQNDTNNRSLFFNLKQQLIETCATEKLEQYIPQISAL